MIYTSTELFNAFMEDTRQIMVRVKINGAVFDNDNISTLNLEYGSMDGANFSLGSTFASSLKITFAELVEGLAELDEIKVEMGAVLPNGTIEYVPMGTFIINEEVMMDRNNNTTSIDALDRMVMLGNIYESTLPGESARIIDIAVDIANQAGVVVSNDFDRLRTDSIQIPREKTLREAIGIIAQFEVGFATFNRDGELAIRRLNDPDFDISPEDYTLKGLVKNEVPFRLNGVQCQIGDSEEDVLQTGASTGTQIVLNNPSMTQAHLDRIYTELSTLNYYPFSLDWYGHPALEAGDWIEIEDLQGNKFKTPNLHYTLDFNGGLKAKSQAETTSSSEVVYQYKSPLQQEIQAIAARLSASGGNHVYDDLTPPTNPKEGDLWFKPEGPDTIILIYERLEDGSLDWVEKLNTGDTTKNAREIEAAMEEVEEAKRQAKLDAEQALADAKAHADAEVERIDTELSADIGGAIDKANQAYEDAKAYADAEVLQFSEHFDGVLAEVESDVADAQATADSAVEQIDTAVTNAGFASLDDTVQNMTTITMDAEQNAQQAITNASNAYDLAQTSISEAQTAQANSLTALGKADNALDGVSSLNVRVDDVEAELELKADNAFMNEDGTLTTLSNAITFNANKFSSDMSRIESRVESLAGEANLVILRNALENTRLIGDEVYPNATANTGTDTMSEMINVVAGEELALSKNTVGGDNTWRISFYDNSHNYVTRATTSTNEYILTVPAGATKMWVSYPTDSQPQIVRGTSFIPYRPNLADQMTSEEINIFRNEYDEFADKTERRLTAIDSSDGRLATAELLITQTANGLALKADQTTVNELTGEVESLGTEFDIVAGQVNSRVWNTDIETAIDGIEVGGRNLVENSKLIEHRYNINQFLFTPLKAGSHTISFDYEILEENVPITQFLLYSYGTNRGFASVPLKALGDRTSLSFTVTDSMIGGAIHLYAGNNAPTSRANSVDFIEVKVEKGNVATDWTPAPEDTLERFDHIETEWTQTFDTFSQTVSSIDGRVTAQKQTLDSISSTVYDEHSGRLSTVEQTASGLQSEVYNADGSSKVTQLSDLLSSTVEDVEGNATQISQLSDNINLRVTKGDVVSQINIEAEQTLIQTGKLLLDAKNTIVTGDFAVSGNAIVGGDMQLNKGLRVMNGTDSVLSVVDGNVRMNVGSLFIGSENVEEKIGTAIYQNSRSLGLIYTDGTGQEQSLLSIGADGVYVEGKHIILNGQTVVTSDFTVTGGNVVLDADTTILGDFSVFGKNITLDADTTILGDFSVFGKNITLDGDTTVTGDFTVAGDIVGSGIRADNITTGTLDAGQITVVNLDVRSLSGNTAEFVTAGFNGVSSWMQLDSDGIHMSGSGSWRRTILTATGFDLYGGGGGASTKAGAIGYFKPHHTLATENENYIENQVNSGHFIGMVANRGGWNVVLGYQPDSTVENGYERALQVDGDTGRIRVYSPLSAFNSDYELNLIAHDASSNYGVAWERSNSGIMFADNGTKIWDESGRTWDSYNMTTRGKIGFYGDSGVQVLTTDNTMDIWAGGEAIKFWVGTNALRFQVGRGAIQAYTDIGMNGNVITGQSDERLKTNIRAREELIINKLKQFNFVDFDWIESGKSAFGLIAQQVQKFAPELVIMDETNMLTLNNTMLNMYTTKSVVEINQKVDDLTESTDNKIHKLQQELSKANRRIAELEGAM